MLLFYSSSFGSAGNGWYVGPLLFFLLPLLLDGSVIGYVLDQAAETMRMVLQLVGLRAGTPNVTVLLARLALVAFIAGVAIKIVQHAARNGGWRAVLRALFFGTGGAAVHHAGQQQHQRQQTARQPRATIEQVAAALQKLPTEVYASRSDIEGMSALELKERAAQRGLDPSLFLERRELVERLLAEEEAHGGGNSSASTCAICSEDYASGDALRVLRCGHKFHIECVDRWLLALDFSRPPACPMCNAELLRRS